MEFIGFTPLHLNLRNGITLLQKKCRKNFNYFDQAICFVGHSHLPGIFEKNKNNKVYSHNTTKEELDPESHYIINVGSLRQPRDGNPDSLFFSMIQ